MKKSILRHHPTITHTSQVHLVVGCNCGMGQVSRKEILTRLLKAQREILEYNTEYELISLDEIKEIRKIWITERQDWQGSLPDIFDRIMDKKVNWGKNDFVTPGSKEVDLLEKFLKYPPLVSLAIRAALVRTDRYPTEKQAK